MKGDGPNVSLLQDSLSGQEVIFGSEHAQRELIGETVGCLVLKSVDGYEAKLLSI